MLNVLIKRYPPNLLADLQVCRSLPLGSVLWPCFVLSAFESISIHCHSKAAGSTTFNLERPPPGQLYMR